MRKQTLSKSLASLTASGLLGVSLFAQMDDSQVFDLAPFVVEADGSQNILQITQRDLSQRQANDLEDVLSIDPSITVGGSVGVAQKIYVRNIGEGMLTVSVDGALQSGSLFHHIGRIAVEPELLKQVEVQSGIGGATDGPGALGGSIKFITKDPSDLLRDGHDIGALIKYGYFDNTSGYKASANLFGRFNENWSGLFSYVSSEYDDIEDGDGKIVPGSDSQQKVAMAKLVGEFDNGQALKFSFERIDENGMKLQRPEYALSSWNPLFPMDTSRDTLKLGYEFDSREFEWLNLDAHLSYSEAAIVQDGRWGLYEGTIESKQFSLSNIHKSERNELIYGFDYRDDDVNIVGPPDDTFAYNPEKGDVLGFFIQDTIDPTKALQLTFGLRYDDYSLTDSNSLSFDNDGFSPSFGASYEASDEITLRATSARAYRGPEINDPFTIGVSSNDPNLTAEKAQNHEIALNYSKNGARFEVGYFQNDIDNVITTTVPWKKNFSNVGKLETEGIFARTGYHGRNYNVSLLYNQADTTLNGLVATRYEYGSIVSSIGDTWVVDAFWQVHEQLDVGWNIRLVEGIDDIAIPEHYAGIPNATINKAGYSTNDFFLRWRPAFNESLSFNFTVKNLFDKFYRSHGAIEDLENIPDFEGVVGANEPGRDLRLSANVRF